MSEEIDPAQYIDSLPFLAELPKTFAGEFKELLRSATMRQALGKLNDEMLMREKSIALLDFTQSDAPAKALRLQGMVEALRMVPEFFIDLVTTKEKDND